MTVAPLIMIISLCGEDLLGIGLKYVLQPSRLPLQSAQRLSRGNCATKLLRVGDTRHVTFLELYPGGYLLQTKIESFYLLLLFRNPPVLLCELRLLRLHFLMLLQKLIE